MRRLKEYLLCTWCREGYEHGAFSNCRLEPWRDRFDWRWQRLERRMCGRPIGGRRCGWREVRPIALCGFSSLDTPQNDALWTLRRMLRCTTYSSQVACDLLPKHTLAWSWLGVRPSRPCMRRASSIPRRTAQDGNHRPRRWWDLGGGAVHPTPGSRAGASTWLGKVPTVFVTVKVGERSQWQAAAHGRRTSCRVWSSRRSRQLAAGTARFHGPSAVRTSTLGTPFGVWSSVWCRPSDDARPPVVYTRELCGRRGDACTSHALSTSFGVEFSCQVPASVGPLTAGKERSLLYTPCGEWCLRWTVHRSCVLLLVAWPAHAFPPSSPGSPHRLLLPDQSGRTLPVALAPKRRWAVFSLAAAILQTGRVAQFCHRAELLAFEGDPSGTAWELARPRQTSETRPCTLCPFEKDPAAWHTPPEGEGKVGGLRAVGNRGCASWSTQAWHSCSAVAARGETAMPFESLTAAFCTSPCTRTAHNGHAEVFPAQAVGVDIDGV